MDDIANKFNIPIDKLKIKKIAMEIISVILTSMIISLASSTIVVLLWYKIFYEPGAKKSLKRLRERRLKAIGRGYEVMDLDKPKGPPPSLYLSRNNKRK